MSVAPIYPSEGPLHDYGRDHGHDRGHVDDRGRDHDDHDRHSGNDVHDYGRDHVVHHDCVHGYFCFPHLYHLKPPRGLHRPTNNNKNIFYF